MNYSTTINFEIRQQQRDFEQLRTEQLLAMDMMKQDQENTPKDYHEYAGRLILQSSTYIYQLKLSSIFF